MPNLMSRELLKEYFIEQRSVKNIKYDKVI